MGQSYMHIYLAKDIFGSYNQVSYYDLNFLSRDCIESYPISLGTIAVSEEMCHRIS